MTYHACLVRSGSSGGEEIVPLRLRSAHVDQARPRRSRTVIDRPYWTLFGLHPQQDGREGGGGVQLHVISDRTGGGNFVMQEQGMTPRLRVTSSLLLQ